MAAEVGQPFSGWSHSDLPYNDHSTQVDDSVQQMVLDHGSVSFGRFAGESLSWENRSVFEHNRRHEEINKLTMPGLVAQKKAFFEEYYKKKARKAMHLTEATSEEMSDDNTLDHSRQDDKAHAVVSEDPMTTAPSSISQPSIGVSSSDEKECHRPHVLGYVTFNPLFSRISGSQGIQHEETSSTGQQQYVDGEFQCATRTSSNHGLNHETLERKVLAPKHVISTDYGESNVAASRIVLPIASLHSKGLKVGLEKQEPRKNIAPVVTNRFTKEAKDPSSSLIQIPRVDSRRNSENRNSEGLKDPFYKRVEMKLRALSDRMSADRAAASSKSASCQPATGPSSYPNADRAATSSRSALCQNTDRVRASSAQASPNSLKERAATVPHTNLYNKKLHVSHVASSNHISTGRLAAKSSVMPKSSQNNTKPFQSAQVASKRATGLTSTSNVSQNKRKQLSTPAASDESKRNRGLMRISASTSASSYDNIRPAKAAKAPRISNGQNTMKTENVKKSTYGSHPTEGTTVLLKRTVNCNEQNRKVISSRVGTPSSSMKNKLTCKSKPRQERPRWR
ncbi:protein WVD2-like 7 [Lolium rigidum]|uniref:protein WVD2-like 7 n=1 Tax=Lolium rigidum TaxID=89674 RepID=UPI001F5CE7AD|nr:protein WVD2-like 7 [Lolium rigidum]